MAESSWLRIRPAIVADARVLASVHLNTVVVAYADIIPAGVPALSEETLIQEWQAAFEDPSHKAFLAEDNGKPVGTVAVRTDPDFDGVGQLRRLYVLPARWARGAGTSLYEAALAALKGDHYPEAGLWVFEKNVRARHFYERRGWTLVPDAVVEWPEQVVEVRYRLVIGG